MPAKMNVLITGAFGFVGSNVSAYLAARGYTLVAVDVAKKEPSAYSDFYTWDRLGQIDWTTIDAVIHLAGKAHDTRNVSDPQSYFDVNVGLTKRVLEAFAEGLCDHTVVAQERVKGTVVAQERVKDTVVAQERVKRGRVLRSRLRPLGGRKKGLRCARGVLCFSVR